MTALVLLVEDVLLDLLVDQEVGVAASRIRHAAQHLTDDDSMCLSLMRTPWSR
jgi:hypothetical protein